MHAAQTFADFGSDDTFGAGPERTSILAIVALVLGIIAIPGCILAGLGVVPGVLAILLGVLALVMIGGSGGRVGGKGVAVAGIATGFVGTVLSAIVLFTVVGGFLAVRDAVEQAQTKLIEFDQGNNDALKPIFASSVTITDAQYAAFRDAYRAEYGDFVGLPVGSFGELFAGYEKLGPAFENNPDLQNWNGDRFPVPAEFANGWALAVLYLDQNAQGEAPFTNIILIGADGTGEISLADMPGGDVPDAANAAPAEGDAAAPETPETPDAPAPDVPAEDG